MQISEVEKIIKIAGGVGIALDAIMAKSDFYGPSVLIIVWKDDEKLAFYRDYGGITHNWLLSHPSNAALHIANSARERLGFGSFHYPCYGNILFMQSHREICWHGLQFWTHAEAGALMNKALSIRVHDLVRTAAAYSPGLFIS